MTKNGWQKVERKSLTEILADEYAWHKGFFIENENREIWKRNYNELKQRDIALFSLGSIQGKSVLDIGCGAGMYALTFLKMGASNVAGIDISEDLIAEAKQNIEKHPFSAHFEVSSCTKLPFADNSFDLVFSGDVFEHLTEEYKRECIAEVYRVLKPSGKFTIKTPNLLYLKGTLIIKRLKAILRLKNPFSIHIAHTHNNPDNEHIGLTTHKALKNLLLEECFHEPVITYQGIHRENLPKVISRLLKKNLYFNQDIIITAQKSIFLGLYP